MAHNLHCFLEEGSKLAEQKKILSEIEVVAEIRVGATDEFLMKKYGLSEKGLQSLFQKLIKANRLTQEDLDRRASATQTVFRCPACDFPQSHDFKVCPKCGIVVEKFLKKITNETVIEEPVKEPADVKPGRPGEVKQCAWYEHGAVVIPSLVICFPIGLYLLWKSPWFKPTTKLMVTGGLATLVLLGILLPKDRTNRPLQAQPVKQTNQQTRGEVEVKPSRETTSGRKLTKTVADCEEPEISFPVQTTEKECSRL